MKTMKKYEENFNIYNIFLEEKIHLKICFFFSQIKISLKCLIKQYVFSIVSSFPEKKI